MIIIRRSAVTKRWIQASLPVHVVRRSGGGGLKRIQLASTALLAFAEGTRTLQSQILRNSLAADEDTSAPLNHWLSLSGFPAGDVLPV